MTDTDDGWAAMLDVVPMPVIRDAADSTWREVHNHPPTASCECLVAAVARALSDAGYDIVKRRIGPDSDT